MKVNIIHTFDHKGNKICSTSFTDDYSLEYKANEECSLRKWLFNASELYGSASYYIAMMGEIIKRIDFNPLQFGEIKLSDSGIDFTKKRNEIIDGESKIFGIKFVPKD